MPDVQMDAVDSLEYVVFTVVSFGGAAVSLYRSRVPRRHALSERRNCCYTVSGRAHTSGKLYVVQTPVVRIKFLVLHS